LARAWQELGKGGKKWPRREGKNLSFVRANLGELFKRETSVQRSAKCIEFQQQFEQQLSCRAIGKSELGAKVKVKAKVEVKVEVKLGEGVGILQSQTLDC